MGKVNIADYFWAVKNDAYESEVSRIKRTVYMMITT